MKAAIFLAALLAASAPAALCAETIAITGATVALGDGSEPVANGTVVIRDGRIAAAGAGVAVPAGARVIDAQGKWWRPASSRRSATWVSSTAMAWARRTTPRPTSRLLGSDRPVAGDRQQ